MMHRSYSPSVIRIVVAIALLLLSVVTHCTAVVQIPSTTELPDELSYDNVDGLFEHFQVKYHREYHDASERERRFEAFKVNVARIQKQRKANPYANFGLTHMADYFENEQYKKGILSGRSLGTAPERFMKYSPNIDLRNLPLSVDWRKHGALNPVRDQMQCGSCWAFAIVGVCESMWFLKTGILPQISEQMLVSCDPEAHGCKGADIDTAVHGIVHNNKGILASRDRYPYVSGLSYVPPCDNSFIREVATVKQALDVGQEDEVTMAAYVAEHGPLVVSIDATDLAFYHSGILTNMTSIRRDHAVVIVGYGNTTVTDSIGEMKNLPYWIVRNSWSALWGEEGYFRLLRGENLALISSGPVGIVV